MLGTILFILPTILKFAVGASILGFIVWKCNSYRRTYDEIRIKENQERERKQAEEEADKMRKNDFKIIHKLNTDKELTIEEKHKLLQEIGTK